MKVIDIYHVMSRQLYYDLDNKMLIKDQDATNLKKKCTPDKRVRWVDFNEGVKATFGTQISTIYGNLYEI